MTTDRDNAIRAVAALMHVRRLSEDDFNELCNDMLTTDSKLTNSTASLRPVGTSCDICGDEVELGRAGDRAREAFGFKLCKACIDTALALIFGPQPAEAKFICDRNFTADA